jgi:hypothetical protein
MQKPSKIPFFALKTPKNRPFTQDSPSLFALGRRLELHGAQNGARGPNLVNLGVF